MAAGLAGKKPDFEGWLHYLGPKGGFFKLGGWKKKWVSLVGNECKIFDKQVPQGLGKPSSSIFLQQITNVIGGKTGSTKAGKENGFVVTYTPLNVCLLSSFFDLFMSFFLFWITQEITLTCDFTPLLDNSIHISSFLCSLLLIYPLLDLSFISQVPL